VFVFLRRIFGVTHRAVRAPVEPFGMIFDPRMVGRTLNGEIEREFEAASAVRIAQPPEVVERAELRMDRVVAAFAATDRVSAPYVAWLAAQAVVLPFAVCVSDWEEQQD